jgi:hypothetical protein
MRPRSITRAHSRNTCPDHVNPKEYRVRGWFPLISHFCLSLEAPARAPVPRPRPPHLNLIGLALEFRKTDFQRLYLSFLRFKTFVLLAKHLV